jgi:vacuolar iron transporter family protein
MVHHEEHFRASDSIKDIVIGMSDGLTVPFALAAGLSGALTTAANPTHIVIAAGLAEIAAGSIAMGLGGYLAAKGDNEHYVNERFREQREVKMVPEIEESEIIELMQEYGVTPEESHPIMTALKRDPEKWVDFMMKFELGLEKPDPKRSYISAATIGVSYIIGGLVPLAPYFFFKQDIKTGLFISACVTLIALLGFGYFKSSFTTDKPFKGAVETMLIGGAAATAAFFIAKIFA